MEDLGDWVKAARGQVGTLSHGRGDFGKLFSRANELVHMMHEFLVRRRGASFVAAAFIVLAVAVNYLRGRVAYRRMKKGGGKLWYTG